MKTLATKEVNYSLHNVDNYNKELDTNIGDIVGRLAELLVECVRFITDNVKLKQTQFSRFIVMRGLDTVLHVFHYLLFYTKNLELTYFHCQKAFYLYVEFVGQISEDEKMFLQLSSRDATTYVYKKTIFDINSELRKTNEYISDYTRMKIDVIELYMDFYKTVLTKWVCCQFLDRACMSDIHLAFHKASQLVDKTHIRMLVNIATKCNDYIDAFPYFIQVITLLLKKMTKPTTDLTGVLDKFLSDQLDDKLLDTPERFTQWVLN